MRFKFFISKPANKFYYLQNLTNWHFTSRSDNIKKWEEITGPLNSEEEEAINQFANILKRIGYKSIFPGVPFFLSKTEAEAFKKAEKFLDKNDLAVFKRTFKIFNPKFSLIWKKLNRKFPAINKIKNEAKSKHFKKLIKQTSLICDNFISEIKISVIISPLAKNETAAGTAFPEHDAITFEIPTNLNNEWVKIYSIGVMIHEIIHVLLEKKGFSKKIKKIVDKKNFPEKINGKMVYSWINESIVESFAPQGFLMQNYYPNKIADALLLNADRAYSKNSKNKDFIRHYLLWNNYPAAIYYGRTNKKIDNQFIEKAVKSLEDLLK